MDDLARPVEIVPNGRVVRRPIGSRRDALSVEGPLGRARGVAAIWLFGGT